MSKLLNSLLILSLIVSSVPPANLSASAQPSGTQGETSNLFQVPGSLPSDSAATMLDRPIQAPTSTDYGSSTQITIDDSGFQPSVITVTVGSRVTWFNATATVHTLRSGNLAFSYFLPFASGVSTRPAAVPVPTRSSTATVDPLTENGTFSATLLPGNAFSYTFDSVGDFPYSLATLPQSVGHVVVVAHKRIPTATASRTSRSTPTPYSSTPTSTSTQTLTGTPSSLGTVCVLAFNDLNKDGKRDIGEPLLGGVTITARDPKDNLVGTVTTNINVLACFWNLKPGSYTLFEKNPVGYVSTTPDQMNADATPGKLVTVEFGDAASPTPPASHTIIPTTEWVNFYGLRVFMDGALAPVGTHIHAYNPRGTLAGEFIVQEVGTFGLLPVYRNDPQTSVDEGLEPNEPVSFTVDGRPADVLGPDKAVWTSNGDLRRADLSVGKPPASYRVDAFALPPTPTPQPQGRTGFQAAQSGTPVLIPLQSGWNLISFPVTPAITDSQSVLASIAGLFSVVLSYDQGGLSYYPTLPSSMNTLRTMDAYHGYWIKMNSAGTLAITGDRLPEAQSIPLFIGWNLVSFPPKGAEPLTTALASISGQFSVVLGYDQGALSYYPTLPPDLNTLKSLDLNHGYWIKMNNAGTLVYPAAAQTATPVPTATPYLTLPATPTKVPTATATPTLGPRIGTVYPPSVISTNTTWRPTDGTFVISNIVTINQGVVLTIEPGTVVKFNASTGLVVNGRLVAEGASNNLIVFTSIKDDAYAGDTNSDGTMSAPGAGDWGALYFGPTSTDNRLKYARVTYGGTWACCSSDPWRQPALLFISGAAAIVDNVNLEYGTSYGLLLANSAIPTVTNSRIAHIAGRGVQINSSSAPTLQANLIESNQGYAMFMEASAAPHFNGNQALNNGTNGIGVNGTIAPSVTWDTDLPYIIDGSLSINPGISLTLKPGAILKFKDQSQNLMVNGTLQASGVITNPITFTSLKDDIGGDTNNDGSASRPSPGDWQDITFSNSSNNSLVDYAVIRYAGYGTSANVTVNGSAPTITHSQITNGSGYGIKLTNVALPNISDNTIADNNNDGLNMVSSSVPTLASNGFVNNTGYAIRMDATCSFTGGGNTASNNVYNGIGVSGSVPANTTWLANLPYIIDGGITVNGGIILTLQPGVIVKFKDQYQTLLVNGTLKANGTSGNKIVFTSLNDIAASAGGASLGQMRAADLQALLAPGDWGRIEFASTSSASQLSDVVVRYGGSGSVGSIFLNGSAPSISNSIISYSSNHGLYVSGSSPTISNNVFVANGNAGIFATSSANPIVQNNQIFGNTLYGLYNNSAGVIINATNNWWGSATGPTHSTNPGGTGDRVTDGVSFTPWQNSPVQPTPTPYATPSPTPVPNYVGGAISVPTTWTLANSPYVINSDVTVNNGVILTIQPGVVVKFQSGRRIVVNGTLAASGTVTNTIVFTSDKDDTYAGDTNGDGNATRPAQGNWGGITFNATANASTMANVMVRYATTGISVVGSSPTINYATIMYSSGSGIAVSSAGAPNIENSVFRDNLGAGISLSASSPTIKGNTFVSNGSPAITMDGNSLPDNSNNRAYYNQVNGIRVSGIVGTRGTWHNDLPYVLDSGTVVVDTGVVLSIESGAILKFGGGSGLTISGGLVANGTSTNHLTFTSTHDDSVGGDTNNNGSQTWAAPGDWSLIHFAASSLSSSSLTYADITYGGVQVTGAAPTIANNLIAYASGYGLRVLSLATPSIRDNIFRDNRSNALQLETSSAPNIQNNQFIRNQGYAVFMDASCTPTFIGNTATDNRTNGIGVSGYASASTTWKANLTYVIEGWISVNSGVTLTLEPGTVVKLTNGASITANGNLVAVGTSANKITFTSLKDDTTGGDTNNDGSASIAAAGDWYSIQFSSSSTGSRLDQSIIRYGGGGGCYYTCPKAILLDGVSISIQNTILSQSGYYGLHIKNASPTISNVDISMSQFGIYLEGAHPTISNSIIHDISQYGIYGSGSNPTITGSTISNSKQGVALYSTSAPYPNISGNTFANNLTYAAYVEAVALPTFGLNTFVGTVGNGIQVGSGTLTANATLYGNGVYVFDTITVEQTATVTIQPGAIIKLRANRCYYYNNTRFMIRGSLIANGTSNNKIIVTSDRDDANGGDTNGDGAATGPAAYDISGLYFAPTAGTSVLDNVLVKYSGCGFYDGTAFFNGAGATINNASPTIRNAIMQNDGNYGIDLIGASPTISGTILSSFDRSAINATSSSFPTITGNDISSSASGTGVNLDDSSRATLTNNTFGTNSVSINLKADALPYVGQNTAASSTGSGINVRSGTIASNATLYPGIVYVLGQITVNAGTVLTAQPGAIAKFSLGGNLLLRGRLAAQGNSSQKIVFTSDRDDTYGGDTNNDGATTTPAAGNWQGIYLSTNDSNIDYAVIKYGGAGMTVDATAYYGLLILNNVSPTISNSTIARSSNYGIYVKNASPNINNNDIWGNSYGIYAQSGARPAIHNNNIHDNTNYGVYNADNTLVVDATNNSWGHDSGPAPVGAGNGVNYTDSGNTRTYWVAFDPWNGKTNWIEQNLGVLKQWIAYAAEPVNTATGNYTYNYVDLRIPGRGLSLAFQRFYNSQSTFQGPLGNGWTCSYCMNVREDSGNALVMNEDGRVDKYVPDGSGGYTPPKGVYDILTKAGTFSLKRKDQTRYNFYGSGRLASIVDKNGNTISLTYGGSNFTTVTDPTGRTLSFSYDGSGRMSQITDPANRTIRFTYDGFGNLVTAVDARNNTTTYAYDSKHQLLTITDPNNHIFVTNIYDPDGRVTTQRDARLNNTTFNYNIYTKVTTVTDPRNNPTTYTYDSELRLQSERDPAGQTISYGYDAASNRNRITDRRANITRYGFDGMGNTTVITDALSGVTTMTYDGMNNLTSQTDPLGRIIRHTYDANGNLTQTLDALNNPTTFAYNGNGLMISTTNARNYTTTFGYDAHGNQNLVRDARGGTRTSTYDISGRKLTETDARNNTTTYTYDANNNLLTATDAANNVTTHTYDAVGNRLTAIDARNNSTTYTYNEKDKVLTVTNPMSGLTRYDYDANDNKIGETDPLTHTVSFAYDSLNRLTQVTNPLNQTTRYGYDVDGNRTSVTDANNKTTNFTYDALNRLTQVTDPLLNTTTYVYDAVGNKIRVIDANGNTTYYEYDAANRLIRVTDALGGVVQYGYDSVGNKTSMVDANTHTTGYVFDELDRLTRVTDPMGNHVDYGYDAAGNRTSATNARIQATTFTYNNINRLTHIGYPDLTAVDYAYDPVGNRTLMTDTTGTTAYAYDALNRVTSVTNPGSRLVSYAYDTASNRTGVTYPDNKTVTYTYDNANRLSRVADWSNRQTNYTYDNAGNLTGQTNPNNTSVSLTYDAANRLSGLISTSTISGTIASFSYTLDKVGNRTKIVDTEGTTNFGYDRLYRLTSATYPDLQSTAYQYDPMGNRQVMTNTLGVTNYNYDAADRLLSAGATSFTWDADGNMLSKGGTTFTYNAVNRLTQVVSGTLTLGYAYDGDGRRASKTVSGTTTNYTYDTIAGLAYVLTEQTGANTSIYTYGSDLIAMTDPAAVQSYYYYDGLGSTRALANSSGQVTARYSYDAFGSVRSSTGTSPNTFKFTGEQTDDEIGLIYLRARYYDPSMGRFLSRDPVPGRDVDPQSHNPYVYVKNNPANYVDPSGEFGLIAAFGIGAVIGGALSGVDYYISHGGQINDTGDFLKHVAIGAVAGGVSGLTGAWVGGAIKAGAIAMQFSSSGAAMVGGMIGGGASAASGQVVKNVLSGRPFQENVLNQTMYGVMSGGIVAKYLPSLQVGGPGHEAAKMAVTRILKLEIDWLDRLQQTGTVVHAASSKDLIDSVVTADYLKSSVPEPGHRDKNGALSKSPYVNVLEELSRHGFNATHPQPPPSHSK